MRVSAAAHIATPLMTASSTPYLLAAALTLATSAALAEPPERFDVAVTVDDVPLHGDLPPGMTRIGIARATLDTLKAHGVVEAFGFVNAGRAEKEPGSEAVLDLWRQAGHPLGNHTASHMNLERASSFDAWRADVLAGEPAVSARMVGVNWRWLRFPNLAVGARRAEALAFLDARGYQVADVSLAFGDWVYTDAYARCVAKGDTAAIDAMKRQYFQEIDAGIVQMKENSRRVYGRVIPQVLLTHLGGWSAVTLPEVLRRLDAAGAHYVTLAEAQRDPAYAEPGGGNLITRAAAARGIKLVADTPAPAPTLDVKAQCR
ncbi:MULTISPECIES: polysaccharide deacetylase family protein [unclassified Massilia]|uniref:polysaccharide deacetylase family protein n=1 Tax=unclassified Massilia TaxID=2609279 RepID=UPI0018D86713|nr:MULTISPECIES: polysaccharide deacetylase family protein [unclassified Massilia]